MSNIKNYLKYRYILGMRVDATNYEDATQKIIGWAMEKQSCYICAANVHMTMEVYDDSVFKNVVNGAALVTPDGMPLVWALNALGVRNPSRVYGPTLTLHVCQAAVQADIPIGLYGGTPESLAAFVKFLHRRFPGIRIACQISPPFRSLTPEEDDIYMQEIVESGAKILFVGTGCPKQELWMATHKNRIPPVMLGVGAAFDFHSGHVKQAPIWMQKRGMEWVFRLVMEPKRLWKRYLKHNPRFVMFFLTQWLGSCFGWRLFETNSVD
jgi:N-acetylglucosaminyldiphosphoundecaprenol N-acetyl-beta-D-mannosaminyltransferase